MEKLNKWSSLGLLLLILLGGCILFYNLPSKFAMTKLGSMQRVEAQAKPTNLATTPQPTKGHWYFFALMANSSKVVGPFKDEADCTIVRAQVDEDHRPTTTRCWYSGDR